MEVAALIFSKAFPLLFILDPFGVVGLVTLLIRNFDQETQKRILRREVLLALVVVLIFFAFGTVMLSILDLSDSAIQITGGIIFFMFSLHLLFPGHSPIQLSARSEPFLVPIAIPMIAGPSVLATSMLYAHDDTPQYISLSAIFVAWAIDALIVMYAPRIVQQIGQVGTKVIEQLAGLICSMIAIEMFLSGIRSFMENAPPH